MALQILFFVLHWLASLLLLGLGIVLTETGPLTGYYGSVLAGYSCLSFYLLVLTWLKSRPLYVALTKYAAIMMFCGFLIAAIGQNVGIQDAVVLCILTLLFGAQWFAIRYLEPRRRLP